MLSTVQCGTSQDSTAVGTDAGDNSGISSDSPTAEQNGSRQNESENDDAAQATKPQHETRNIDGTGNNLAHPLWGSAGVRLERLAPAEYGDGISEPVEEDRPNPREISNTIVAQDESEPNERGLSAFMFVWGQFLDHDLDLAMVDSEDPFPIAIPLGDPYFDPFETGEMTMPFSRSVFDASSGTGADNPRQQLNALTAWIDASQVYGSDAARAKWLRSGIDGKLKTSEGDLLPFNDGTQANAPSNSPDFFVAGDLRVNEQTALAVIQTIFLREHNRLCEEMRSRHPDWSDEQLYQQARRWVGAYMQSITFHEFLPALLGPYAPGPYRGYNPEANPNILNEFSTAFFRVGHTMLTSELWMLDELGQTLAPGNLSLMDAFFNTDILKDPGPEPLLRGLMAQRMEEIDSKIVSEVRNFLFGPPGSGGLDLASLNLQRGRDHGLPDYNTLRQALGLKPIDSFSELNSDPETQAKFQKVYSSVDQIDPWIGALSEDHLDGASVGETLRAALSLQFGAIRDGDRFWHEHDPAFSREDLQKIRNTKLSDILRRNTNIAEIQEDVFRVSPP
ncbi:MAG: peroxidase family protein [Deltaproteobacteria bacterium]|nr:peroxidase family protein [Deltaproteobacteria bacterium]